MSSWDNLIQVLEAYAEHERQQELLPQQEKNDCRVYYDDLSIRMVQLGPPWHDFDPDWKWINVDPQIWDQISNGTHKIEDGKLVTIDRVSKRMLKLSRSNEGKIRTVRGYATLLVMPNEEYSEVDHWQ